MSDLNIVEESWNKKRIIIGFFILIILIATAYVSKIYVLDKFDTGKKINLVTKSVKSASIINDENQDSSNKENPNSKDSLPSANQIQNNIEEKLSSLTKEAANLKLEDIASSSPQIQKIVNDLKSLEQYPKNQAKEACLNICKGIQ